MVLINFQGANITRNENQHLITFPAKYSPKGYVFTMSTNGLIGVNNGIVYQGNANTSASRTMFTITYPIK